MRKVTLMLLAATGAGWWLTADQQGWRYYREGEYSQAAQAFEDPMWQGVSWYRAGDFKQAVQMFARRNTPDAFFNQANSHVMLGNYEEAIRCYDQALEKRPDWEEAIQNRELARARAKALETQGGDMTGGQLAADEIVFDEQAGDSQQKEEVAGGEPLSNAEMQSLWLRRVQTKPADFLRAKFAYQLGRRQEEQP